MAKTDREWLTSGWKACPQFHQKSDPTAEVPGAQSTFDFHEVKVTRISW
jgi:hypothetical protein